MPTIDLTPDELDHVLETLVLVARKTIPVPRAMLDPEAAQSYQRRITAAASAAAKLLAAREALGDAKPVNPELEAALGAVGLGKPKKPKVVADMEARIDAAVRAELARRASASDVAATAEPHA